MRVLVLAILMGCGGPRSEPVQVRLPSPAPPDAAVDAAIDAAIVTGDPARGYDLTTRKGCLACHTADGRAAVGPSWKGLWGRTVTTTDGRTLLVDAAYVRRALLEPQADIVAGFPQTMPAYGEFLDEAEIADLTAYVWSLRDPSPP